MGSPASEPTMQSQSGRGLLRLTGIVTLIAAVGTIPVFALAALGPQIVVEFGLTRTQFGALTAVTFLIAAGLSPFIGGAADRYHPKHTYSILFLISVLTLAGTSFSTTYPVLVAFVAITGISEALTNPLSNRLIALHIPPKRHGLVTGIKQSGVHMGAVFAGVSLPLLSTVIGWRGSLLGIALLIVVGWLTTVVRIPEAPFISNQTVERAQTSIDRSVIALIAYAFMMGSVFSSGNTYLPLYAHEVVGLGSAVAGTLISAVGILGITSRILIGHIADRVRNLTLLLAILASTATIAMWLLLLVPSGGTTLLWLGALFLGSSAGWNTVVMIAVLQRGQTIGRASGHVMGGFFAGYILAPVAFGRLVDQTGAYAPAWSILALLLTMTSIMVWVWERRSRHVGKTRSPHVGKAE